MRFEKLKLFTKYWNSFPLCKCKPPVQNIFLKANISTSCLCPIFSCLRFKQKKPYLCQTLAASSRTLLSHIVWRDYSLWLSDRGKELTCYLNMPCPGQRSIKQMLLKLLSAIVPANLKEPHSLPEIAFYWNLLYYLKIKKQPLKAEAPFSCLGATDAFGCLSIAFLWRRPDSTLGPVLSAMAWNHTANPNPGWPCCESGSSCTVSGEPKQPKFSWFQHNSDSQLCTDKAVPSGWYWHWQHCSWLLSAFEALLSSASLPTGNLLVFSHRRPIGSTGLLTLCCPAARAAGFGLSPWGPLLPEQWCSIDCLGRSCHLGD